MSAAFLTRARRPCKGGTAVGNLGVLFALLVGCAPSPVAEVVPGSGTVSGSFDGRPFDTVGAAWRIGRPDDAAQTMVIYVFDAPIRCDEISAPAWDAVVADQTQSVEMKVVGTAPGTYPVALRTPGPGESDVNYTLTSQTGTPAETAADSGTVIIDTADAGAASGSFNLVFPSGDTLAGTFAATPCSEGSEP